VVVPEPSHLESRDPELRDSWQRVDARAAPGDVRESFASHPSSPIGLPMLAGRWALGPSVST
jgi:hypothetical protein